MLQTVTGAGSLTERARFTNSALTFNQSTTVGSGSSQITLGGSSGDISVNTSGNLYIYNSSATYTTGLSFGIGTNNTGTSGTRIFAQFNGGFAPTSGSATFTSLGINPTINQTGGASGIVRGVYMSPTLTALADYRAYDFDGSYAASSGSAPTYGLNIANTLNLTGTQSGTHRGIYINPTLTSLVSAGQYRALEIVPSNTNAWGVYQSGANTKNHFNGHILAGTTTDQSGYQIISAGPIYAGAGHLLVRGSGIPASETSSAAIRLLNTIGSETFDLGVEDDDEIYIGTGNAGQVAKINVDGVWDFPYGVRNRQIQSTPSFSSNNYTAVLGDEGKVLLLSNGGTAGTFTIPPNASVAFPVGAVIDMAQTGSGQITVTPGSGVTINSADSATKLRVQYSTASIIKTATNTWLLVGDIST